MFKYLCDFNTIGAGQAVFAIRAGDRYQPAVFLPYFIDEIQLVPGKQGGTGSTSAVQLVAPNPPMPPAPVLIRVQR